MNILGISCYYHDSSATLVVDGKPVAAASEERFSRNKHDNSFPENAIDFCLRAENLDISQVDRVVFYEKPLLKFDRILETAAASFPRGFKLFSRAIPEWLGTKLRVRKKIRNALGYDGKIEFIEHHKSHAASAFYPSPFDDAAVLTVDGVGEWTTNQMLVGENNELEPIKSIRFPDSLGLLYSAVTAHLGFMVNNDEYKVMGLASYGEPVYREEFKEIVEINEDGSYSLDQEFFSYTHSKKMWSPALESLLGQPRETGADLTERHKNIASTLQKTLEDILLKQVSHLYSVTETENLCMAGGVALNSAANGTIRDEMEFDNIWIQPAAGDSGGSMGAALEQASQTDYKMNDVYLGPKHSSSVLEQKAEEAGFTAKQMERKELVAEAANRIANGQVCALYQGRVEWGPRALGNRSILADPRKKSMIDKVNKKIKFRESFRPFAPTVLEEEAHNYFETDEPSPYMLFVHDVVEGKQQEIPAVTHVDGTSRIQTLNRSTNPFYHDIISKFFEKTDVPVLLNTSFNLKGMPIVNRPEEAVKVLKQSGLDAVVTRDSIVSE